MGGAPEGTNTMSEAGDETKQFTLYVERVRAAQEKGEDTKIGFFDKDTKDRFLRFARAHFPEVANRWPFAYWSESGNTLHVFKPTATVQDPAPPDDDPPNPLRRIEALEAALLYMVRSAARWGSLNTRDVDHVEKLLKEGAPPALPPMLWRCGCGHSLHGDPTDGPIHCDQVGCSCLQCRGVEVK